METWSAHHVFNAAKAALGDRVAAELRTYAIRLSSANLPVIFTLRHLAKIVGVDYQLLRSTVERRREAANYRMFSVKKRSGGFRVIHAASNDLFKTQQFINSEILQRVAPHSASFAFHRAGGIVACASSHAGTRWIFKFDLEDFFFSINEVDVYQVFLGMGYRPLLAFELGRICTTTRLPINFSHLTNSTGPSNRYKFYRAPSGKSGVLPQGAPTSPMLSNLCARRLDERLSEFSQRHGFVYTRYADDITLSSGDTLPPGISTYDVNKSVVDIIIECGFRQNKRKTRVLGPGARKLVLGLLVDGPRPKLSKNTRRRIRNGLHSIEKYGLQSTAQRNGFDSAIGFYNHISGLISFSKNIDHSIWESSKKKLDELSQSIAHSSNSD